MASVSCPSDESVTKRALSLRLELLETATVFLSKEYNVSCSSVHPILQGLITSLESNDEDVPMIRQFKVVVAAALMVRWSFDDIDVTKPPAIVSVFDPRFKMPKSRP